MNQTDKAKRFRRAAREGRAAAALQCVGCRQRQIDSRCGRTGDRNEQLVCRGGAGLPRRRGHSDRSRRADCGADRGDHRCAVYSEDDDELAENVSRLLDLGVIGINFEDRVVKGSGLYSLDRQARRIAAIRKAAEQKGIDLFINARTDVFFEHGEDAAQAVGEALDRAKAYAAVGASGFFVPGLVDDALIGQICESVSLPVNVMVTDGVPSNARLSELGVARISYGPIPYIRAMKALGQEARTTMNDAAARTEGRP